MNKIMFEKLSVREQKEVTAGTDSTDLQNPGSSALTVTYYCLNAR